MNVSVKKIIAKEWLILIIAIIIGVVIIFVASQIYDYSHNQYYQHLFDNLKDNDVIKQVSFKHEIDNEWQLYLISPYVFFNLYVLRVGLLDLLNHKTIKFTRKYKLKGKIKTKYNARLIYRGIQVNC